MKAVNEASDAQPRLALLAIFDVLHKWFTSPDFRGCQFINAAAEFPLPNDPVHKEAANHKLATRQFLCDTAEAAGAADPVELSDQLMVLVEGAVSLRQVTGDDQAAATARKIAKGLVGQAINET